MVPHDRHPPGTGAPLEARFRAREAAKKKRSAPNDLSGAEASAKWVDGHPISAMSSIFYGGIYEQRMATRGRCAKLLCIGHKIMEPWRMT